LNFTLWAAEVGLNPLAGNWAYRTVLTVDTWSMQRPCGQSVTT